MGFRVHVPNYFGTWDLGNSNSCTGFEEVYDDYVLGPLGSGTFFQTAVLFEGPFRASTLGFWGGGV